MPRRNRVRRPGEGSVYQRKDGRWVLTVTLEDHSRKSYYFDTEKEAIAKQLEVRTQIAQGNLATGPQQTVKQFLEYWLEDVQKPSVRLTTYTDNRVTVHKHLVPALGHIKLQKLTTDHIQSFYAKKLKSGMKAVTITKLHRTFHGALEYARRTKRIATNPSDEVRLPYQEEHEPQALTSEQARLFIQQIKGHSLEGIVTIALATGMREGELLGLRWSDINLTKKTLQVSRTLVYLAGQGFVEHKPKTAKGKRKLLLPDFAVETLKRHRVSQLEKRKVLGSAWIERDLVFPNDDGDFLIAITLLRRFHKLLSEVGLPRMRFHDLRHSAATLLLSMNVPLKVVSGILGHSNISVTADRYGHLLSEMQEDATKKMNTLFDSDGD